MTRDKLDFDPDEFRSQNGDYEQDMPDEYFECPTRKGSGTVNPLTAPEDFFCVGATDCPHCDGTGEI